MPAVPGLPAPLKALTVAPFGMEEGSDLQFPDREFGLIVGEPAEFRFFTSAIRKNDPPGTMLEEVSDELEELAPVEVVLESDGQQGQIVRVTLETVVLPNIWHPYEEGTSDPSLRASGEMSSTWHQFLRCWYRTAQ